jgi:hypothetical protein
MSYEYLVTFSHCILKEISLYKEHEIKMFKEKQVAEHVLHHDGYEEIVHYINM